MCNIYVYVCALCGVCVVYIGICVSGVCMCYMCDVCVVHVYVCVVMC